MEDHVAEEQHKPLLNIRTDAPHKVPNAIVGCTTGTIPKPNKKRSRGERGGDVCCVLCRAMSPGTRYKCKGRGGMTHCEHWNSDKRARS